MAKEATRVFLNHPEDQKVDSAFLNENDGFFQEALEPSQAAWSQSRSVKLPNLL